jgi:hypothetical protein
MLAFLTRYVRESLSPGAKFAVRMTYSYTRTLLSYPKSRYLPDAGFSWTLKPAVLETKPGANQEARSAR